MSTPSSRALVEMTPESDPSNRRLSMSLILRQRLVREQIQRAGAGPREHRFQRGEEVDQALAARRRGRDEDVGARADAIDGVGLMIVEGRHAEISEGPLDRLRQRLRHGGVGRILPRQRRGEDDIRAELLGAPDALDEGNERVARDARRDGCLAARPRPRSQRALSAEPYS